MLYNLIFLPSSIHLLVTQIFKFSEIGITTPSNNVLLHHYHMLWLWWNVAVGWVQIKFTSVIGNSTRFIIDYPYWPCFDLMEYYGLATSYGFGDLGQIYIINLLGAWWQKSQYLHQCWLIINQILEYWKGLLRISITEMILKTVHLKLQPHIWGAMSLQSFYGPMWHMGLATDSMTSMKFYLLT